jgi:phosphoglycerate kinase
MKLKNKTILLRIDINSEIIKGKPQDSARIKQHTNTISFLKKQKAKVIILAHQGSPGKPDFTSLKHHTKLLSKYTKVHFTKNPIDTKAIISLPYGQALLLENVRFLKEEFKPSTNNKIVNSLAPLADLYINDALSICHRKQTSIISLPKVLPSQPGPVLKKELSSLKKLDLSKTLFILGGAKTSDNISIISHPKTSKVLTGGLLAPLVIKSQGISLGKQDKILKPFSEFFPLLKKNKNKIAPILDLAILKNNSRQDLPISSFPQPYKILDNGKETTSSYIGEIKKAKSIFFRGALGLTENPKFAYSTNQILKEIAKSKAYSIIGGGNTLPIIERLKIPKSSYNYISLSGGALVQYIIGKELPGLKALGI